MQQLDPLALSVMHVLQLHRPRGLLEGPDADIDPHDQLVVHPHSREESALTAAEIQHASGAGGLQRRLNAPKALVAKGDALLELLLGVRGSGARRVGRRCFA